MAVRYGVFSDVHGNLAALETAVAALRREAVDAFVCAGDLVGYGPLPNECVDLVTSLDPLCVAGNHDLMVLGGLSDETLTPLARETLRWTQGVLRPDVRDYLAELPLVAEADDGLIVAHGALHDASVYVTTRKHAVNQLGLLSTAYPESEVLVLGHTHRAVAFSEDGTVSATGGAVRLDRGRRYLLNPGSVGQARERRPLVRFMVLDLERREATFHALPYDIERCRRELRLRGFPAQACHLPPSLLAECADTVRRLADRIR